MVPECARLGLLEMMHPVQSSLPLSDVLVTLVSWFSYYFIMSLNANANLTSTTTPLASDLSPRARERLAQQNLDNDLLLNKTTVAPITASAAVTSTTIVAPIIQETIFKPVIIEETVRTDKIVEIQPIITRHVEQPIVHRVESHVYQPAAPAPAGEVTKAPIVNEVIHPHIVNEVQEVIHKEVSQLSLEHIEQASEEHVTRPTLFTNEVVADQVLPSSVSNTEFIPSKTELLNEENLATRPAMQAGGASGEFVAPKHGTAQLAQEMPQGLRS